MADNITIPTTGSGTTTPVVATDDVGGVHYQKVKITLGADGAVDALVDSGQQTSANSVPVVLASDQSAVPVTVGDIEDGDGDSVMDPSNNAIRVNIVVDEAGIGGGTQYTEDAAAAANPIGTALILVREDALAGSLTTADGDNVAARGNNKGEQYVKDTDAAASLTSAVTALQLIDNLVLAEDAAHGSGDPGVQALAVRKDTGATIAGADGDYSPLQVDASGNLRVNVAAGGAAGGTSITDDAAFTPASSALTPIGGMFDDGSPDTIDEGDAGVARMTSYRALHVNLRDNTGNELAVGGGTQYTEDAAAAANPVGNALILVREDALAGSLTSADGDNVAARGNNKGEQYVKDADATAFLSNISGNASVLGGVVRGGDNPSAANANGVNVLAVRRDTAANVVTADGDYTSLSVDGLARLWTHDPAVEAHAENIANNTTTLIEIVHDEDSAHTSQDFGIPMLSVRRDTAAVGSGTDGDYSTVNVDGSGRLWTHDPVAEALLTTIDADTGNIAASLQLLDNLVLAEDAAHGSGDPGVQALAVRKDAGATIAGTDGDYSPLQVDADGNLRVNVAAGGAAGTQYTEDAAAAANPVGTALILVREDALAGSLTTADGDNVAARGNNKGEQYVKDTDAAAILTTIDADTGNIATSMAVIDDWDESDRAKVNIIAGQAGVTAGAGTVAANTPRVTLASDDPAVVALQLLDNAISGAGFNVTQLGGAAVPLGGGTEATALRVTIASDSTGVVSVDDNGGSLTVDGTVAISGTVTVASHAVTNAGTFAVQESGAALTALQLIDNLVLAEDAAHGSGDPGVQTLAVRKDTGATIAGTDGDYSPLQVDADGNLRVNVAAGGAAGTQYTEDAAAAANPVGTALILVRDDALAGSLTTANGDNIAARGTNWGEQYVKDNDAYMILGTIDADTGAISTTVDLIAGALASIGTDSLGVSDAGGSLTVDNGGTFVTQENGAALTALQLIDDTVFAEDVAAQAGDKGIQMLAVRRDADTSLVGTDNDYAPLQVNANGALKAEIFDGGDSHTVDAPVGTPVFVRLSDGAAAITTLPVSLASVPSHAVTNAGTFAVQATATGDVAHDAADSGNPVKVGSVAYNFDGTVPGTAVAEGDRVNQIADLYGRQYVETTHPNFWDASVDYNSAQTNASIKTAPGAGLRLYITDVIISNGATAGNITLLDGSGGTVKFEVYPGINGGAAHSFRSPLRLSENTALCITSTTVTTHSVTVSGYIAP